MAKLKLLKDYMDKVAVGCVFTFMFDIDQKHEETSWIHQYSCNSSKDFVTKYGTVNQHILTDYYVERVNIIHSSNDQGIDEVLILIDKKKYDYDNKPVTFTAGQHKIINNYYAATMDCLVGNAVIMDTGSSWNAMEEVTARINKLSPEDKNKIRSIFLGYNYKRYVKD